MKTSEAIEGIIFDMDGVLCDSEPFICEAAMEMFRQTYGLTVKKEDFLAFVGAGEDRFVGGVGEKYGIEMTMPRDKLRTYEIYLKIIAGRLHPLPGAVEFVSGCRAAGKKIALATAADAIKMRGNLHELGIAPETFHAIITGDDVQRKKPDPQVFLLAAKRLDLAPSVCVVVEDAINGVKAAKAAGARCLGITTSFEAEKLRESGADWTAENLASVPSDLHWVR